MDKCKKLVTNGISVNQSLHRFYIYSIDVDKGSDQNFYAHRDGISVVFTQSHIPVPSRGKDKKNEQLHVWSRLAAR